jgi:transcriptional regulator with XRE-family HTH domain
VAHITETVAETVARNIQTYRGIRKLDQVRLARRMESLGIPWRRVTVSEVERGRRNVTLTEALGLALALEVTVEQLVDPRGTDSWRLAGPSLVLTDAVDNPDLPAGSVAALLCRHILYAENFWDGDEWNGVAVQHVDGSPPGVVKYMKYPEETTP